MASKGARAALWVVGLLIILAAAGMVAMAPPWKAVALEEVTESVDVTEQVKPATPAPPPDDATGVQPGKDTDDLGGDETPSKKAEKKPAGKAPRVAVPRPAPVAKPVAVTPEKKPAVKAPVAAVEPKKAQPPEPPPKKVAEPAAVKPAKTEKAAGRAPSIGIVEEAKKPAIGIVK